MNKNMSISKFINKVKKKDSLMIKTLEFEYELNKNFDIEPEIAKQLSVFLSELTRADDYTLKEETLLNSLIVQRVLMDFQEVDSNYHKFKTHVTQRFPGVVNEE